MFILSPTPLEKINLRDGLNDNQAGAFACFEGLVRNHNEGKKVIALEYEAQVEICAKEFEKISSEVQSKFKIIRFKCYHRVGRLEIGEMAVWVGVIAPHRDDAFKACRYIIDELKKRLPIWKKEFYMSGESEWIGLPVHEQTQNHN